MQVRCNKVEFLKIAIISLLNKVHKRKKALSQKLLVGQIDKNICNYNAQTRYLIIPMRCTNIS